MTDQLHVRVRPVHRVGPFQGAWRAFHGRQVSLVRVLKTVNHSLYFSISDLDRFYPNLILNFSSFLSTYSFFSLIHLQIRELVFFLFWNSKSRWACFKIWNAYRRNARTRNSASLGQLDALIVPVGRSVHGHRHDVLATQQHQAQDATLLSVSLQN